MSTECYSCHAQDFQKTTGPSHVSAGFSPSCQECHDMNTWFNVKFDHMKFTGFALTGMHATLQCTACHVGGRFKGTPADCVGCHMPDYQKTNNPPHAALGMPQTCQNCHTTAAWVPATFDHNLVGFPLTGAHAALPCSQCHTGGKFTLTVKTCVSCHLKDYQSTTNPNHAQQGFPQTCEVCHSTAAWQPASFNHAASGFPLTGAHATTPCASCHVNNNYHLTSTACVSCHLKDFQGTTNPNHVAVGFPQQCNVCHNTTAWIPASFNHNNTAFPLTGAHVTVPCASCHVNNNYTTLPTACYSCHKADYTSTTNPNHTAAGFPTTCTTCHNTTAWIPANWNHTYFPINHGNANGVCATCHTNPNNYAVFTCTNCHTKANTDQQHQGVGGYVYNSINCYQCHQNGGGGG
jgi:hypothetical protein